MDKPEVSAPLLSASRLVIAVALVVLSTVYDKRLWFASAEPRWMLLHVMVLVAASLYFCAHLSAGLRVRVAQPWPVWAALAVGLTAAVSFIHTHDPLRSWWALKHLLACITLFWLVVAMKSESWYRALAWAVTLALGLNGLLGILQYHGVDDQRMAGFFSSWSRLGPVLDHFHQVAVPGATFINKNVAASYAVLTVPIAFAAFLTSRGRGPQLLALLCCSLGATLLIYSRTRSSWLGAALACGLFAGAAMLDKSTRALLRSSFSRPQAVMAAVAAALVLAAANVPSPLPSERRGPGVGEQLGTVFDIHQWTYVLRWANNLNTLKLAVDHPLHGVGIGAFRTAYPPYHDAWVQAPSRAYDVGMRWDQLHNDWLQAFAELGVPGGMALLAFFAAVIALGWKTAKGGGSAWGRTVALFATVGITGLCIDALANFPLQMPTAGLAWCVAAWITGIAALSATDQAQLSYRTIGRRSLWPVVALMLALTGVVAFDDLRRWESGHHLTTARRLNSGHVYLGRAIDEIDRAYAIYPYNDMVHETRALTYARDTHGSWALPEKIIGVIEESLRHDPYSSYLLITLGKLYTHQGLLALTRGEAARSANVGDKLEAVLKTLQRVAGRRAEVPAMAGYIALFNANPHQAAAHFDEAMKIDPGDPFVSHGASLARQGLK